MIQNKKRRLTATNSESSNESSKILAPTKIFMQPKYPRKSFSEFKNLNFLKRLAFFGLKYLKIYRIVVKIFKFVLDFNFPDF